MSFTSTDRTEPMGELPLSLAQQAIWSFEQTHAANVAFNIPLVLRLSIPVDFVALERALSEIVRRHQILRTRFFHRDGAAMQAVLPPTKAHPAFVDLQDQEVAEREAMAAELARADHMRPFDLNAGRLFRTLLIQLGPERYDLSITFHHLVVDGWSLGMFLRELALFYESFAMRRAAPTQPLPRQFHDHIAAQAKGLAGGLMEQRIGFWRETLESAPDGDLPTDRARPPTRSFRGARVPLTLPADLAGRIQDFARSRRLTPFTVLLGALQLLVGRLTNQKDAIVGAYMANRNGAGADGIIGPLATVCPLRLTWTDELSFEDALAQAQRNLHRALPHQDVPYEATASRLGLAGDRSRNPIFGVAFNFQNAIAMSLGGAAAAGADRRGSEQGAIASTVEGAARFDLELFLEAGQDTYLGHIEYATDLFDPETAAAFAQCYQGFLEQGLRGPGSKVSALRMASDAEVQVVRDWNATAVDIPPVGVPELFSAAAAKTPDADALLWEGGRLTYRELAAQTDRLGTLLRDRGVGRDVVVGLWLQRSPATVIAALSVLKAGGAFLGMEVSEPPERAADMLGQARAALCIFDSSTGEAPPPFEGASVDLATVDLTSSPPGKTGATTDPTATAYVIFTSGSTGQPKGVLVEHRSLTNNLLWMQQTYALAADDRMLLKTPLSFDVSVWELFWPLTAGAALVISTPGGERNPVYLAALIKSQQVTTIQFVPSMLSLMLGSCDLGACTSLRRVITIGEALPRTVAQAFCAISGAGLYNLYGPAEATLHVTAHDVRGSDLGRMPIGRPISNCRVYVLDRLGQPTPLGVPGEIFIAGDCVARGYVNAPDLTAERFGADPFVAGARMYRSGDLGRWTRQGVLEFLGRADHQVKIHGVRIELGEVEAALRRLPTVKDAAVSLVSRAAGTQLIGHLVLAESGFNPSNLRRELAGMLPATMIPDSFVQHDQLPISPNGKLDRSRLLAHVPAPLSTRRSDPETELEKQLVDVWREVLGFDDIGLDDDVFDLGANSLLVVQAAIRVTDVLQREIDAGMFYDAPTVRELATQLQ